MSSNLPSTNHREPDRLFELAEVFLASSPTEPQRFCIRGHAYELDIREEWDRFEEFCRMIAGKDDNFYGTNKEVLLPHHKF